MADHPTFIPVYAPWLAGNEAKYVQECLATTWISSKGRFVDDFEAAFAKFVGCNHAISVNNGTTALHLALAGLKIGPGDKVAVPTFTYIASVNAIRYVGAEPVFIDSDPSTLQMSVEDFDRKARSTKLRCAIPVHLYGQPCDMTAIQEIAKRHEILLVEDSAEAFGARIGGRHVGNFSEASTWSFFGNKTITTGEGGMVTTNDSSLAYYLRKLRGQGLAGDREYWHDVIGFNFRMTNICAAIGLAQMENAEEILQRKRKIAEFYRTAVKSTPLIFHDELPGTTHSFWMCSVLTSAVERDHLRLHLRKHGIETRPFFYPAHTMPMYTEFDEGPYPSAMDISHRGINLPSSPTLSEGDLAHIAMAVREFYQAR